jgi:hypothetical protein
MADPDLRALCAELLEWADRSSAHYYVKPDLFTRARAALSQPAPEPPTDEELAATFYGNCRSTAEGLRTVWARWGQTMAPVPIAERLPGEADWDAQQRCWFGSSLNADGRWNLEDRTSALNNSWYTHWLPSWALPRPGRK